MVTTMRRPVFSIRALGWLAVGTVFAAAVLVPSAPQALATSFDGAIWTTIADGTKVNANIYADKDDVYINGGPQNCGRNNGLPDGAYYFQVTDPSGHTLLSTDAIASRQVAVINGVITGHGAGTHAEGTASCNGGLPVQLMPFADTPNPGNEYSVDLAPKAAVEACPGFSAGSTTFNFLACAPTKNDNFKAAGAVQTGAPVITPAPTPGVTAQPTATVAPVTPTQTPVATPTVTPTEIIGPVDNPTPTPYIEVLPATGNPQVTLPPTDASGATSGGNGAWRLGFVAVASLLAGLLVVTSPGARRLRRGTRS
jgi:hypothetical protein